MRSSRPACGLVRCIETLRTHASSGVRSCQARERGSDQRLTGTVSSGDGTRIADIGVISVYGVLPSGGDWQNVRNGKMFREWLVSSLRLLVRDVPSTAGGSNRVAGTVRRMTRHVRNDRASRIVVSDLLR